MVYTDLPPKTCTLFGKIAVLSTVEMPLLISQSSTSWRILREGFNESS